MYEASAREIREAYAAVERAERKLQSAFLDDMIRVRDRWDKVRWDKPDESLAEVERRIWESLVEHMEIRRFMSIRAYKDLSKQLGDGDMPPLTLENAQAMANGFRQNIDKMLEESVVDVFQRLTPQSDWRRLKTNSKFEVGKKVILTGVVERGFRGWWIQVGQYRSAEAELSALENVFSALDGRGSVTKGHYSEISLAIKAAPLAETCEGMTTYFKFRGYRNGNLHITFRRLDLLKRFNAIAGGARLRPAT